MIKETPKNTEAEQHILAALASGYISTDEISYEDFYDQRHKHILKSLIKLKQHIPVNGDQIWNELEKEDLNGAAGTYLYIMEVLDRIVISETHAEYWFKELKQASIKRNLISILQQELEDITENNKNPEDSLAKLKDIITDNDLQMNNSSLNLISVKGLFSKEYKKIESLWGDLLYPSSIVQLNSVPGLGKTTLLYNLLLHGARKENFLNISFPKEINTIYVDVETPEWVMKKKVEAICDTERPDNFYFRSSFNIYNEENIIVREINYHDIDVLVLDTQSRIFEQEDENNNAQANSILSKLRYICKETGVCIVLVHHLGKDTNGKGVYSGRGASAVAASVDIVINLSSLDSEVLKLEVVKNRLNNDYFVMGIKKVGDDRFESYEINDPKSLTLKIQIQDEILILPHGRYKASEIQSKLQSKNYAEASIRRALTGLAQSGKVKKIKHGEYEIYSNKLDIEEDHNYEAVSEFDLDNNTIPF